MPMLSFIAGLAFLFLPQRAGAQVTQIIEGVTGGNGGQAAENILNAVYSAGMSLVTIVSVAILVRAAAKMIGSASEKKMEEGRTAVGAVIIGLILVNLTGALVTSFWSTADSNLGNGAQIVRGEILGLVGWAQVVVVVLAVAMIVLSAFKVIASFGKEDAGDEMKKSVTGVVIGILLIVFDTAIASALGIGGSASPRALITVVVMAVRNLMVYLGLLAVIMIIYAGIMMIVTVGNDDQYGKSKGLVVRVLIGLVIIMFSYFIVSFISGTILAA